METIKTSNYVINKLNEEIENFCINQNIERLQDAPQNIYTACLMSAGRAVFFKGFFYIDKNKNIIDLVLLDRLCDYYIYICKLYNKVSSVYDFSLFLGLNYRTVSAWNTYNNNDSVNIDNNLLIDKLIDNYDSDIDLYINNLMNIYNNKSLHNIVDNINYDEAVEILTAWRGSIISKLHVDREKALTNRLVSNQNAMGTITAVNREYKWNIQELAQTQQIKALTLSELPKLDNI